MSSTAQSVLTLITVVVITSRTTPPVLASRSYSLTIPTGAPASLTTGVALIRCWVNVSATCCVESSARTVITGDVMTSPAVTCAGAAAVPSCGCTFARVRLSGFRYQASAPIVTEPGHRYRSPTRSHCDSSSVDRRQSLRRCVKTVLKGAGRQSTARFDRMTHS